MSRLARWQLTAAAVTVATLALIGGGRYPLYVDLMVYLASGAAAAVAASHLLAWREDRRADRPEGKAR